MKSPEGLNGRIQTWYTVANDSLGITVNPPGSLNGPDPLNTALGDFPGYHHFFLNFTIAIYNTFGPYKFASQSETVHTEYNNTIVK